MTNILRRLLTSRLLKRNEILDIILPVSIHHRHPPLQCIFLTLVDQINKILRRYPFPCLACPQKRHEQIIFIMQA